VSVVKCRLKEDCEGIQEMRETIVNRAGLRGYYYCRLEQISRDAIRSGGECGKSQTLPRDRPNEEAGYSDVAM
jgi:hypothetical protein